MQAALFEPARELVRFQAGREQEALRDRHAEPQQELALRFGFHAFGDEPEAEAAAERLGVKMMLPLGACFLPAFILLGVVPVVVSMLPDALGI